MSSCPRPIRPSGTTARCSMSLDVYAIVTDRICGLLEAGTVPWRRPWCVRGPDGVTLPANLLSHRPYRGINVPMLAAAGYASPYWLAFKQAQQAGGYVRRG